MPVFFDLFQQFFSYVENGFPGSISSKQELIGLAQGHNTVTPVRLEPKAQKNKGTDQPLLIHCLLLPLMF